jgi:hypothetical protein
VPIVVVLGYQRSSAHVGFAHPHLIASRRARIEAEREAVRAQLVAEVAISADDEQVAVLGPGVARAEQVAERVVEPQIEVEEGRRARRQVGDRPVLVSARVGVGRHAHPIPDEHLAALRSDRDLVPCAPP